MLKDIEPGADVTGGLTGSEGFDLNLIQLLCERVESHARRQGNVSHLELIVFIKQLGIMTDQLRDEDIEQVIQAMVFDERLEKLNDQSG